MTNDPRLQPGAVSPALTIVGAFLDGERVDAMALKQALSTEEGRDYLVDLLAIRRAIAGVSAVSLPALAHGSRRSRALRWAAAAALVTVASAGGYVAGERRIADAGRPDSRIEAALDAAAVAVAPQPTRVIRLEPGVNWHASGTGEN